MVFQFSSVKNGEMLQREAKALPIGFMKRTSQLLQFVISRNVLLTHIDNSVKNPFLSPIWNENCIWEFRKGINRIAFAQNIVIPIVVFFQIIQLLGYLRLDRTMGTLLMTIRRFIKVLAKLFLLMIILIIPYGWMQENFLYPNQYLTT